MDQTADGDLVFLDSDLLHALDLPSGLLLFELLVADENLAVGTVDLDDSGGLGLSNGEYVGDLLDSLLRDLVDPDDPFRIARYQEKKGRSLW